MELIYSIVIAVVSSVLTLFLLATYLKRTMPTYLVGVTNAFGQVLSETLKESVADPTVKRAMSVLGKQSGEIRRNRGAEREFAEGIIANLSPEIQVAIDQFAPDLIEKYGADTVLNMAMKYAPMIKQFLGFRGSQPLNQGEQTRKFGEF